jgi:hypothetical protein
MSTTTDTRNMTLVDLPLVRRLTGCGVVLDSEIGLTRDARGPNSFLLSSLLFPRGIYTLVARSDEQQPVVGQFRYRPDDPMAHIVYLAPTIDDDTEDTIWLHILDAMAREAGKRGAHSLVGEVEVTSPLFETLRTAGFATYARQVIWRHEPLQLNAADIQITLEPETDNDQIGIMALIANIVPTMIQQVATPHSDMEGLVYRKNGRIEAYIAVSEGANGVYLLPMMHPDVMGDAADIIAAAIARMNRASKVPVYVCIRSYHGWLSDVLHALNFEAWVEQAVMVKQIAAGIRHPGFAKIQVNGKVETTPATRHYWSLIWHDCNYHEENRKRE